MSRGPMADYPHASAACLCYLDEKEGGEERERESKDAGRLMFTLFSFAAPPDCPHCPAGDLKLAGERKRMREGVERG